jgi:FdrA protein
MATGFIVRKNQYYDSLFLMGVNKRILDQPGVTQSAVLMGSDANKELLGDIGLEINSLEAAGPNDLIVAVVAEDQETIEGTLARFDEILNAGSGPRTRSNLRTLQDGLAEKPNANLAVISLPGEYAAHEARKALESGLHVFLFSDNVPLDEELELKTIAAQKGLLVMGPDCGTSLIGGKGIGFANAVRRGRIGAVGPSGTGLQEFTSQVHNAGQGISHAIGTGSHDLSDSIGGLTTIAALDALEADPNTSVIAIISKPPSIATLNKLTDRFKTSKKPIVGCFLGIDQNRLEKIDGFHAAATIDSAVEKCLEILGEVSRRIQTDDWNQQLAHESAGLTKEQVYIRGLFAGGTFCYQSQQILREAGLQVYSNAPLEKLLGLDHPEKSRGHTLVDMGDDFYTRGKPHPMIDGTWRRQRILNEARDPSVAVLLLDFILGYNASPDPVGDLLDAIIEAKKLVLERGGYLTVVVSICGTDGDPQDLNLQSKMLQTAGVVLFQSNALASKFCAELIQIKGDGNG